MISAAIKYGVISWAFGLKVVGYGNQQMPFERGGRWGPQSHYRIVLGAMRRIKCAIEIRLNSCYKAVRLRYSSQKQRELVFF